MNKKLTILITAIGSSNGRAVANVFGKRFPEFDIIGTDVNNPEDLTPITNVKQTYKVPYASEVSYSSSIYNLCRSNKVDYIIPVHDSEVLEINNIKNQLAEIGTKLFSSSDETLEICRDKFLFYKFCQSKSIPTIHSSLSPEFDIPMFLKPRKGNGSVDCYKIESKEELELYSKKVDNHFFQKFESGRIFAVDFVADNNSNVLCLLSREELQTKSGIGVKVITRNDDQIRKIVGELLSHLKYVGIGGIEFFVNKEEYTIIELNTRPSSGLIFTYMAGLDIFANFFNAAGESWIIPRKSAIKYDLRMHRELVAFEIGTRND